MAQKLNRLAAWLQTLFVETGAGTGLQQQGVGGMMLP